MDYFIFDLQLFADPVTVDLTDVKNGLTATSTKVYVKSNDDPAVYSWKAEKGINDVIVAELKNGTLTVTDNGSEKVILKGNHKNDKFVKNMIKAGVVGKATVK